MVSAAPPPEYVATARSDPEGIEERMNNHARIVSAGSVIPSGSGAFRETLPVVALRLPPATIFNRFAVSASVALPAAASPRPQADLPKPNTHIEPVRSVPGFLNKGLEHRLIKR